MVLYNVTLNIESNIEQEWLSWMKNTHIPEVMKTGRFLEHKFLRLLNEQPDATGVTYAVQYFANSIGDIDAYLQNEAPALQQKTVDKYGERVLAFRTVLEEVI